jgi:hypothetical protein
MSAEFLTVILPPATHACSAGTTGTTRSHATGTAIAARAATAGHGKSEGRCRSAIAAIPAGIAPAAAWTSGTSRYTDSAGCTAAGAAWSTIATIAADPRVADAAIAASAVAARRCHRDAARTVARGDDALGIGDIDDTTSATDAFTAGPAGATATIAAGATGTAGATATARRRSHRGSIATRSTIAAIHAIAGATGAAARRDTDA